MFNRKDQTLKCFFNENRRLNYLRQVDRKIRTIEIDKIKGSVGRCLDFDAHFQSKSGNRERSRFSRIKRAMEGNQYFPTIELYKLRDEYYILDGHHRVSAAKEIGYEFIDAHVIEYLPSKKRNSKTLGEFEKRTGLKGIYLTHDNDYHMLLSQINDYHADVERNTGESIAFQKAAHNWSEDIYKKVIEKIRDLNIDDHFPGSTVDDIYVRLCELVFLQLRKAGHHEMSLEMALEKLKLLSELPSSNKSRKTLTDKIKKIFLPCYYTGKCAY